MFFSERPCATAGLGGLGVAGVGVVVGDRKGSITLFSGNVDKLTRGIRTVRMDGMGMQIGIPLHDLSHTSPFFGRSTAIIAHATPLSPPTFSTYPASREEIFAQRLTRAKVYAIIGKRIDPRGIEVWLSLVERYVRDVEVASSNLVTSTIKGKDRLCGLFLLYLTSKGQDSKGSGSE